MKGLPFLCPKCLGVLMVALNVVCLCLCYIQSQDRSPHPDISTLVQNLPPLNRRTSNCKGTGHAQSRTSSWPKGKDWTGGPSSRCRSARVEPRYSFIRLLNPKEALLQGVHPPVSVSPMSRNHQVCFDLRLG